jgi:hypothetical protein
MVFLFKYLDQEQLWTTALVTSSRRWIGTICRKAITVIGCSLKSALISAAINGFVSLTRLISTSYVRKPDLTKPPFSEPTTKPSRPETSSSSPMKIPTEKTLVTVDWRGALTVNDAIHSYLVEEPGSYYIPVNRQWLMYLDRDYGMLEMIHDFSDMDDDEISDYILGVLELLYK